MHSTMPEGRRLMLHGLYRPQQDNAGRCVYCDAKRDAIDHVPAIARVWKLGAEHFAERGIELITVEACASCNKRLHAKPLDTIDERREFLQRKPELVKRETNGGGMGRPPIYQRPMTTAERKARSRALRLAAIVAEADLAAQHIRAARQIGTKKGALHLTDALHALARLQELIRP